MSFSELTVIVKDDEKTLRNKFAIYEAFSCHHDDPVINMCVERTLLNFNAVPDHIEVKITMDIK